MKNIQEIIEEQKRKEAALKQNGLSDQFNPYYDVWTAADLESLAERFLDLRLRDGTRAGFDYGDRKYISYVPEEEAIRIEFVGHTVSIFGRSLNPELYDLLLERKVSRLQEASAPDTEPEGTSLFVEEIYISAEKPPLEDDETQDAETPPTP